MTLIEQIATYLQTSGVGTLTTNIFMSYMPDDADSGVCVLDTGGPAPDPYLPTKSPTFQIFIRAVNYDAGKAKMDTIRGLLHRRFNDYLVANETYVYFIEGLSEGGHIGRNDRGLDEFSMNFICKTR